MVSNKRRASVLIGSLILIVIAAFAVGTWMVYLSGSSQAANRDRMRMHAFYAAEAGIEQVVEYFNHPERFTGAWPENYDDQMYHPNTIELEHDVAPEFYELFEPYIQTYLRDPDGFPLGAGNEVIWDRQRNRLIEGKTPLVTSYSFFADPSGNPAAVSLTSKIPSAILDISEMENIVFFDSNDREIARVTQIELVHPADLSNEELTMAAAQGPVISKVISTGRAINGVEIRVESLITQNMIPNIVSPAAIISGQTVDYAGNFNVYWGEVWSRNNINLPSNFRNKLSRNGATFNLGQGSNSTVDPWFRVRTEGYFRNHNGNQFADGRQSSGFGSTAPTAADGVVFTTPYHQSLRPADLRPNQSWDFDGLDNMQQNDSLDFPVYDYTTWKNYFQVYDLPYFFTDTNGNIYGRDRDPRSNTYGQIVQRSYDDWFGADPSDLSDYWDFDQQFAFIDSVPVDDNGNPAPIVNGVPLINESYYPRDPSSDSAARMATIQIAGGGTHTRGTMFMAANLRATGSGNPPRANEIRDPDGNPYVLDPNGNPWPGNQDPRVAHNGFMYSWGRIEPGGQRTFYGSVHAEGGYGSNGTPSVFYNSRLKDGTFMSTNMSRVRRTLWDFNRPVVIDGAND